MTGGPTREVYAALNLPRVRRRRGRGARALPAAFLLLLLGGLAYLCVSLRSLSLSMALSQARDMVTLRVAETVGRLISEEQYAEGGFVTLEKDGDGHISAVTTDTVRLNQLSSELGQTLTAEAESGHFDLSIPLGDLLGMGLLQGVGPAVPLRIGVMSSSDLRFESAFSAVGINQTLHTLRLAAEVEIELLVPWGTARDRVSAVVPVAETVIVGTVPEAYFGGHE